MIVCKWLWYQKDWRVLQEPQRGLGTVWGYRGGRVPLIREIGRRNAHDGGDGSNSGSPVLWRTQERRKDFFLTIQELSLISPENPFWDAQPSADYRVWDLACDAVVSSSDAHCTEVSVVVLNLISNYGQVTWPLWASVYQAVQWG